MFLVKSDLASQAHTFQPGAVYDKKIYLTDDLSPEGVYLINKLACLRNENFWALWLKHFSLEESSRIYWI